MLFAMPVGQIWSAGRLTRSLLAFWTVWGRSQ